MVHQSLPRLLVPNNACTFVTCHRCCLLLQLAMEPRLRGEIPLHKKSGLTDCNRPFKCDKTMRRRMNSDCNKPDCCYLSERANATPQPAKRKRCRGTSLQALHASGMRAITKPRRYDLQPKLQRHAADKTNRYPVIKNRCKHLLVVRQAEDGRHADCIRAIAAPHFNLQTAVSNCDSEGG
jgi:hypothetical protein